MNSILPALSKSFLDSNPLGRQMARLPLTFCLVIFASLFHALVLAFKTETVHKNPVISALAVSPSSTLMGGKFWTVFTASLVEENTMKCAALLSIILLASAMLERDMGTMGLGKLLIFSQSVASLASTMVFLAAYFFTLSDDVFFSHVFGLGGVLVTLAVGLAGAKTRRIAGKFRACVLPCIAAYSLLGMHYLALYDAVLVVLSFPPAVYLVSDDVFTWRAFFTLADIPASSTSTSGLTKALSPEDAALAAAATDPAKERFRARGFKLLDKKLAELEAAPEISLDDDKPNAQQQFSA